MAKLAMKRINIVALKENRKKILEFLQIKGAIEVHSEKASEDNFEKMDTTSARQTFEKNANLIMNAKNTLDEIVKPEKGEPNMFSGKTPMAVSKYYENATDASKTTRDASRIVALGKKSAEATADIIRLETQIEALEPWTNLDISMRTMGTQSTHTFIGSFPETISENEIRERLAADIPEIDDFDIEVISSMPQQTAVFIICHAKNALKLETALRSMGLTYPSSPSKIPPSDKIKQLSDQITELKKEIADSKTEIASYADKRDDLLFAFDYYNSRAEKYKVLGDLWQSNHVFVVTGYVPEKDSEQLKSELESKYEAFVELDTPTLEEDVPVKLQNNGYAAPVEGVVEAYSLPTRGEVDPCSVMAIFYYVLFGMMLSDAAYGFIITLATAIILIKCKNMASGARNTMKMFMFSGISTMIWGVLFGSYFGDAIPVIAKTFFDKDVVVQPLWFAPLNDPMRLLMFSMLLGIIHLMVGLAVNFYQLVKQRKIKDAIYDVIFWYFLVLGLIIALVSTEMFQNMVGLSISMPSWVAPVCLVLAVIGAVGIVATAGRESKNPFKRLLKGLYGLYNISGYLSDILSYSRLLALGLATGVIATVFNQMGSMMGGGIGGAIFFTIVFVVGHALNLAINALGAYVHTNRLQYVEFFGKFYSGGGRKFSPFAGKTKYYNFTEEQ